MANKYLLTYCTPSTLSVNGFPPVVLGANTVCSSFFISSWIVLRSSGSLVFYFLIRKCPSLNLFASLILSSSPSCLFLHPPVKSSAHKLGVTSSTNLVSSWQYCPKCPCKVAPKRKGLCYEPKMILVDLNSSSSLFSV